ncbi:sarcosine oxidase subunit alpha family protein [Zavarzinia compransoris]|uniref:sarcosine oxidase subunit alpha family protein n=1 Tax=Zavarzinia compransoris TaxID=1264899 RepID=UPI0010EA5A3E|nr:sarcosine oxidase subunit alpha family protein [Zavarzinia compransoris]TDP43394.1 N-methylglutamate dehydrogenase subunit C [Zavarzinia compransoris]
MSGRRLPHGGLIDRGRPLGFSFDGRALTGYAGDTLAAALLANGVRLVGRSFKYHRPRGIVTAGSEEPNALVELRDGARREPNTKATTVELFDGLAAASQNRWPSLGFDVGAVNGLLSPLFVAGFYYKTFMWPAAFWEKLYEPAIRRAAGLGRGAGVADPDHYEKSNAFCDVLVIGGGPAGLAAALAAGRAGARTILADEDFLFGGRLNGERLEIDGKPGADWAAAAVAELAGLPHVTLLPRTTVFGVFDGETYGAVERVADHLPVPGPHQPRQRLWHIAARRAVLAAGAVERPLVFGGNDRPGVMSAAAVRTYLNRFGTAPGSRAAIFTTGDDGWKTAADLAAAGIAVAAVIDTRDRIDPLLSALIDAPVLAGAAVTATRGGRSLAGITVRDALGRRQGIDCDLLAVSGGWNPTLALTTHLGGKPYWRDDLAAFVPGERLPPGMAVAGAAAGRLALADCLADGFRLGTDAAGGTHAPPLPPTGEDRSAATALWQVPGSKGKSFVDFQHDVTDRDVALAAREGFRSVEHLKRYTTLGMATDQGKTANVNGHALMAAQTGRGMAETGTTRFRPPFTPVALGALAGHHRGRHFKPTRLAPSHGFAAELGATFVEVGQWLRAQWYARPGENDWLATVNREVKAVRADCGICDVSTLGRIEIQGPDAGVLLDFVYANTFSTLTPGKARYGLMLREDGFVMDDGTCARLGPDRFILSTTTANAAKVMQHLDYCRQVLRPGLDVHCTSATEHWAMFSVAGPRSCALLQEMLGETFDVAALPHMGVAQFRWAGLSVRLFRLSFSGELAYEIAVPARYGEGLMRRLCALGATPYGTEALGVMRIEKGHPAGNELSGQTTAADLGLGRMLSTKKDFIGRVLAARPGLTDPDRPALVGFRPLDRAKRLRGGAHFLAKGAAPAIENSEGYMTSVAFSPMRGHWIGLGLLARGPQRIGETVIAHDPLRDGDIEVEVCSPVFYDPEGSRLNG